MSIGEIKKWNDERGFGFIRRGDGQADIFAHIRHLRAGLVPTEGLRVVFEVVDDERSGRPRADNVREA